MNLLSLVLIFQEEPTIFLSLLTIPVGKHHPEKGLLSLKNVAIYFKFIGGSSTHIKFYLKTNDYFSLNNFLFDFSEMCERFKFLLFPILLLFPVLVMVNKECLTSIVEQHLGMYILQALQ